MLIHCPRCNFSQPKDQYCAQCGVDMDTYKPKPQPLVKRILQSGVFQIGFLLTIAVLIGQLMIRSETSSKWVQKITRFQGVSKSIREKSAEAPTAMIAEADSVAEAAPAVEQSSDAGELSSLQNKEISVATSSVSKSVDAAAKAKQAPIDPSRDRVVLKITYAEVSNEMLNRWIAESTNAGHYQKFSNYSAGIILDYHKHEDLVVKGYRTTELDLYAPSTEATTDFEGIKLDEKKSVDSSLAGLNISAFIDSIENNNVQGTIDISKFDEGTKPSYPAEFDLPKDSVFFLVGTVQNTDFKKDRSQLLAQGFFEIFKSADFLSQKSQFIIIVEPTIHYH